MSRAVTLNFIVVACLCYNCFAVLENSQCLAEGNRLRVSVGREWANNFRGLAALAAVLYVTIFSSTLSCISDVVFFCFQCTGNQNCFKAFLVWNAINIFITFVCDIAVYYMVRSVTEEGYKALKSATETITEETTTSPWDNPQVNSRGEVGSEETSTASIVPAKREPFPKRVIAFAETVHPKPSMSYILLVALLKVMVLAMFQQYTDREEFGSNSFSYVQETSTSSLSRIAAWKALYEMHRSTLQSIKERTLEMQVSSAAEEAQFSNLNPDERDHLGFEAAPSPDHDSRGPADSPIDNGAEPSAKLADKSGDKDTGTLPLQLKNSLAARTPVGPASDLSAKSGAQNLLEDSGTPRTVAGISGESSEPSETRTASETPVILPLPPASASAVNEISERRDEMPEGNTPDTSPVGACSSSSVCGQVTDKISSSKFMTAENSAGGELRPPEAHPVEDQECFYNGCYAWRSCCE